MIEEEFDEPATQGIWKKRLETLLVSHGADAGAKGIDKFVRDVCHMLTLRDKRVSELTLVARKAIGCIRAREKI